MKLSKFVDRPILSFVISVFIMVLGIISLLGLPIEKYPDIAPPTISISTMYAGASADAIQKSVIMPIEEAVNGVENMQYINSSASNSGMIEINVTFKQGTDPDKAAVNVQNRLAKVVSLLPAEVTKVGVSAQKRQPSMLRIFAIYSPDGKYDAKFLNNFVHNTMSPAIQRIDGVGSGVVFANKYGMRLWLDPGKMSTYGLVPSDIAAILGDQNIEAPLGNLAAGTDHTFQYVMKYKGRRISEEEFGNIVIKTLPDGGSLRISDVGEVELGLENYTWTSYVKGKPAAGAAVYQAAGSNATQINNDITDYFKNELRLPAGVELIELENGNDFLYASMDNVKETLILAIILVVLVVFFFLQDWRATLIPTVSIIVALIGTFAFLQVAGFTLNLLTLFSLVLVIGTVVDDSICVVEAVQERFEFGLKDSSKAARSAISNISRSLITTTIVFAVVFIPVSAMSGTTGIFYRQFGLTMAVAVIISTLNAMTLSPALAALIMKPIDEEKEGKFMHWVRKVYNVSYNAMSDKYMGLAKFFTSRVSLVAILVAAGCVLFFVLMKSTPSGMVPEEDKGSIFVDITCPMGSSLSETSRIMAEVQNAIDEIPEIGYSYSVAGQGLISGVGSNCGLIFIRLKPWSERTGEYQDVNSVMSKIYIATAHIKGAQVFAMTPPMIDGYGTGNSIELWVQDQQGRDIKEFNKITQEYVTALGQRPEVQLAYCSYNVDYPQYLVDVDAEMCQRRGVDASEVINCIGGYCAGMYASNFNRFAHIYRVMVQAKPEMTVDENSLSGLYVRMKNGEMAPVSQFITIQKVYEPMELKRFNLYGTIPVNVMPAEGKSSGDVINAVREVAAQKLPIGCSVDFSGMAREQDKTSGGLGMVLAICILFVYLVLAALYESVLIPFAVLLSVPVGLAGTFVFAKLYGLQNDIYLQVAIIMLIGLLAKTAILLTEYATQCRRAGMSIQQATIFAAKMRLRPILMTVLTMIFGMLPMIAATGQGANGNRTIGAATVGGMIFGTLSLLLFVPALYIMFQTLQEKLFKLKFAKTDDVLINEEVNRLVEAGELTLPEFNEEVEDEE